MIITDNKLCTGCAACAHSCTMGAIVMTETQEGFLYPVIDKSECIDCGRCRKVCPAKGSGDNDKSSDPAVYAVRSKDTDVLLRSSSGGAFSTIAEHIISIGGVVYGAGFDENNRVLHKRVDSIEELSDLAGSKYVQSFLGDVFPLVKADLDKGVYVLFAGTPCQCAGLKSYLAKDCQKLITIDFVCHGVPSPKLFEKYLDAMSKGKEITAVRFRDKSIDGDGHCISVTFSDGDVYRMKHGGDDPYMLPFLQNISLRESCYNCSFKGLTSGSDITLGDFWGISNTDSILKEKKGVSLFIINTPTGEAIFSEIKDSLEWDKRNINEALKENRAIILSTSYNPLRVAFYRDLNMLDVHKLCHKYCGNSVLAKARRFMARRTIK